MLVIPLATICALSLLPERMAFAPGMPMARQLVLYIEERSRRMEASEAEHGPSGIDEQAPDVAAQVDVAAAPERIELPRLRFSFVTLPRVEQPAASAIHLTASRFGRAPPCA